MPLSDTVRYDRGIAFWEPASDASAARSHGIHRLDKVVSAPEHRKHWKPPQHLRHVVQQQVALAEDQRLA